MSTRVRSGGPSSAQERADWEIVGRTLGAGAGRLAGRPPIHPPIRCCPIAPHPGAMTKKEPASRGVRLEPERSAHQQRAAPAGPAARRRRHLPRGAGPSDRAVQADGVHGAGPAGARRPGARDRQAGGGRPRPLAGAVRGRPDRRLRHRGGRRPQLDPRRPGRPGRHRRGPQRPPELRRRRRRHRRRDRGAGPPRRRRGRRRVDAGAARRGRQPRRHRHHDQRTALRREPAGLGTPRGDRPAGSLPRDRSGGPERREPRRPRRARGRRGTRPAAVRLPAHRDRTRLGHRGRRETVPRRARRGGRDRVPAVRVVHRGPGTHPRTAGGRGGGGLGGGDRPRPGHGRRGLGEGRVPRSARGQRRPPARWSSARPNGSRTPSPRSPR